MNPNNTPFRGAPSRARSTKPIEQVSHAVMDGEPVALVPLCGGVAIFDAFIWAEYLRLGYSPHLRTFGNGTGGTYVAHTAAREPTQKDGSARTMARTVVAIAAVCGEAAGGERAPAKGFRVCLKNGDALDLRLNNLERVPAAGGRNTWKTMADVKLRRKLVAEGREPNAVYCSATTRMRLARQSG